MNGGMTTFLGEALIPLTFSLIFPILNPLKSINHSGNSMHQQVSPIKGFLILCLIAGLTTLILTSFSLAPKPIRTVIGKVTKVSDGYTIHFNAPERAKLRVRLYWIDSPETFKTDRHTGCVNKPGLSMGRSHGGLRKVNSWRSGSGWTSSPLLSGYEKPKDFLKRLKVRES